jgi:hypothetical protein
VVGTPRRGLGYDPLRMTAILVRAIAAAAIPAAVAMLLAPVGPLLLVPIAAAVLLAIACRPRTPGRTALWLFALLLAAIASVATARARELADATLRFDAWPEIDLSREPMPANPPRYLAVTGVLRDGFVLAEYEVAPGGIPDQSRPAEAVLVPITGSAEATVVLDGAIVVARVRASERGRAGRVTLRGRTEPLAPELLHTVVDLGAADAREIPGVLLDTLEIPEPRAAWTAIAVAVLLIVAATIAYAFARRD